MSGKLIKHELPDLFHEKIKFGSRALRADSQKNAEDPSLIVIL